MTACREVVSHSPTAYRPLYSIRLKHYEAEHPKTKEKDILRRVATGLRPKGTPQIVHRDSFYELTLK